MAEVLLDADELTRTADQLIADGNEVAELGSSVLSICCCELPPGAAAYVDAELSAVQSGTAEVEEGYVASANDIARRAAQIAADQSLVDTLDAAYGIPAVASVDPVATGTDPSVMYSAGAPEMRSGTVMSSAVGS